MKNQFKITCQNCGHKFTPTKDEFEMLSQLIKSDFDEEILRRETELDKIINEKVESREQAIRAKIELQKQAELEKIESNLIEQTKKLTKSKRELNEIREQAELKEIEIIEKYDSKLKEAVLNAKTKSDEEHSLVIKQKEKIISDLGAQTKLLQKKLEQHSGQLIGETLELTVEDILLKTHGDTDNILPVPKGVRGADTIQEVMTSSQKLVARIVYEVKNVQRFSSSFIPKLKEDALKLDDVQALVIVTTTMPKSLEGKRFGVIDGVYVISGLSSLADISSLIRISILKIYQIQLQNQGRINKESNLFDFVTSPQYISLCEGLLSKLDSLNEALEKEKKSITKLWKQREKSIADTILSADSIFGTISEICTEVPTNNSSEVTKQAS